MVNLTCIMCPMGCSLKVEKTKNNELVVSGNNCIRGDKFAKEELTLPKRVVTSLVKTSKGVVSVKTTLPVPKTLVTKVVAEIEKLRPISVKMHEVLIKNVLNTGADVIVTGNK